MQQLDPSYFTFIRSNEIFIELKSKNTGHCWCIKKISYINSKRIQVFHKHSFENPYYHKQKNTYAMKEAIEIIKKHDSYILSQSSCNIGDIRNRKGCTN
jgi:hypothetical protein